MDKDLTFEQAYKKLEQIAQELEDPNITLDRSISLFEEGIELSKYCTELLEKAKQKIEKLEKGTDAK